MTLAAAVDSFGAAADRRTVVESATLDVQLFFSSYFKIKWVFKKDFRFFNYYTQVQEVPFET